MGGGTGGQQKRKIRIKTETSMSTHKKNAEHKNYFLKSQNVSILCSIHDPILLNPPPPLTGCCAIMQQSCHLYQKSTKVILIASSVSKNMPGITAPFKRTHCADPKMLLNDQVPAPAHICPTFSQTVFPSCLHRCWC